MASDRTLLSEWRQTQHGTYPDPTDDEREPDPYPGLRRVAKASTAQSAGHLGSYDDHRPDAEAARQYLVLANHLPSAIVRDNGSFDDVPPSEGEAEGVPMANRYLNLHPELPDTDQEDFTVDESEIEAATDVEPASAIGRPRSAFITRGKNKGKPRRGWKWALKGTAHDPKLNRDPKEKRRGGGAKRGKRKRVLDPGYDFKVKQANATRAFVEGRLDEALDAAREAVHANPEIFAAHSLLSEILLAQGQRQDSLAALLSGAVTARDQGTWVLVAQQTLEYAGEERTEEVLQQAIFCYTQAIDLEKKGEPNLDARVSKMHLWIELGEFTKARRDCKQLVGIRPDDVELVRQMAELCAMTGDSYETSMARKSYEFALEQTYEKVYNLDGDALNAAWGHLNIYLELVDRSSMPAEAIFITKRYARKFLGRGDDTLWDQYQQDDREMDIEHTRRYEVVEFQQGRVTRDRAQYGEGLPLELRIKLGLFRLKMDRSDRPEAFHHFNELKQYKDDVETLFDMFYLVATNLSVKGEHLEALQFYEPIKELEDVLTDEFWMRYGGTLKALARYHEAADCFKRASELNPLSTEARVSLAKLYEVELQDKEQAMKIVLELMNMNKQDLIRRERLHLRPKNKERRLAPKPSDKRQREDEQGSSEDDEDDAGDLPVQPVRARKKRKHSAHELDDTAEDEDPEDPKEAMLEKRRRRDREKRRRKREAEADSRAKPSKANERKLEMLESMSGKVSENYEIVNRLWPALESEDDDLINQWSEAALTLYEIFRSVRHFYPTRDKYKQFRGFLRLEPGEAIFMNNMEKWKKQLEGDDGDGNRDFTDFYAAPKAIDDSTPKDFYDIPFSRWHHIFVDLALLYARKCRQAACYQIIDDGLYAANVFFHDQDLLNTTQATSLCCGFIFNDSERLCFAARWFLNRADIRAGSGFQLFSGVNRLSYGSNLWFSAGPTQKHMLRSIKALDYHYFSQAERDKFDWSLQLPTLRKRVEKYGEGTAFLDPNALLTYGHMVGVANHSQSALPYFFRAYALQPKNITINLSIATMYIQNAMKRQTDNRQYGIAQGLSFLHDYYRLRAEEGGSLELQEAEFNLGRTWHMLGLTHLAMPAYERALALDQAVKDENRDKMHDTDFSGERFSQEAAYGLVNIYTISGNDEAAMQIAEEWLVL